MAGCEITLDKGVEDKLELEQGEVPLSETGACNDPDDEVGNKHGIRPMEPTGGISVVEGGTATHPLKHEIVVIGS